MLIRDQVDTFVSLVLDCWNQDKEKARKNERTTADTIHPTEAQLWTNVFNDLVIGRIDEKTGEPEQMSRPLYNEYFEGLKNYQIKFLEENESRLRVNFVCTEEELTEEDLKKLKDAEGDS